MSKRRPNNTNDTIHKGDIIYHRSRKNERISNNNKKRV